MEGATSAVELTVEVTGSPVERAEEILTPEALAFVEALQREFAARRDELLAARQTRRDEVARTGKLDFLPETQHDPRRRLAGRAGAGRPA